MRITVPRKLLKDGVNRIAVESHAQPRRIVKAFDLQRSLVVVSMTATSAPAGGGSQPEAAGASPPLRPTAFDAWRSAC